LKSNPDTNRPETLTSLAGGPGQGGTTPNTPIPMGAFTQDFEYVEGLGDLDECNGRIGITPEFPNGIYYYVVTDNFPFFTRCLKGDFDSAGGGGGVPNCGDVPDGAPCCGDGICGGLETEENCPTDCATSIIPPDLDSFSLSMDTVNTNLNSVVVIYNIGAISYENSLSDYSLKLILNGGPINGGEIIEQSGTFNTGLYETSVSGYFIFPTGTSEGQWNIRIALNDISGNTINLSPSDLAQKNFQNYVIVNNATLGVIGAELPVHFSLDQNFPNPFNPLTSLRYAIPESAIVKIIVYDVLGNIIKNIINEKQSPGFKIVQWDATNNLGELVSAGLYICIIEAGDFRQTRKMILLK
jgi:hypothetical protein